MACGSSVDTRRRCTDGRNACSERSIFVNSGQSIRDASNYRSFAAKGRPTGTTSYDKGPTVSVFERSDSPQRQFSFECFGDGTSFDALAHRLDYVVQPHLHVASEIRGAPDIADVRRST